ncbi:AAA family ATPase, partial [Pseudomonas sp. FW305-BF6]|uniref:AAA family ATPase n=1 Tax=Pseudomonas sp. FW305-BF6 TaxID=2070673 RepID=UPI001304AE24
MVEFIEQPPSSRRLTFNTSSSTEGSRPISIMEVEIGSETRIETTFQEFNRVLGGGIVLGSLVLIGGDPGIGKSTMLLQVSSQLAKKDHKVLYVSGEESQKQIKLRAERLGIATKNLFVLSETDLSYIARFMDEMAPDFVVIDSIQTIYLNEVTSAPGSVSQVRECTSELMKIAKTKGIPIFIV